MSFAPSLMALGEYLAGKFDNREQALADPAWFVHLHLWQRPVDLFTEDSITLFAEQANIVNLEHPYRQRIMRLMSGSGADAPLQIQYYMFKDPGVFRGAGSNPAVLKTLTVDQLDLLPGCILTVNQQTIPDHSYKFTAIQPPNSRCCFSYLNQIVQVALGFEATAREFNSYDKGIDSETGKATWGAILGPYRYTKREQY
ncbi:chromophore lyase CpcT/CpeT [Nodularia harveyana UHCC-0300]|uniref:Chromophore lyase CpcT/CpeT n=1 Tax=Nodularia harveyana UHCC-0300 TaxID=2974287 RepID=A0ABU5UA17_9CYAN|nr:chromophore lyase CpcT/CpeT [Nodularia harveyana]MEA5580364.1 chromophore lyase CpcT/CpeT [Nodularia harveyana UHCC-0300]